MSIDTVIMFSTHYPNGTVLHQSDLDISPITTKAYEKAVGSLRQSHAAGKKIATKVIEFGDIGKPMHLTVRGRPTTGLRIDP